MSKKLKKPQMMKIAAIIQARMGSSRLPGKVLKPLGGTTVLKFLIERLARSKLTNEIIIATTEKECDDEIVSSLSDAKCFIFRGSEKDVLRRYIDASISRNVDIIVRVTGDCPLVDPKLVDDCINYLIHHDLDYVSNCNDVKHPLPDGFDVEVFTRKSLLTLDKISITQSFREHVTFGYFKTTLFKTGAVEYENDLGHLRLTLDYEEDYQVINRTVARLRNNHCGWHEISRTLSVDTDTLDLNAHISRNASWQKSFDDEFQRSDNCESRFNYVAHNSGLLSKRADQFSPNGWPQNYLKAKGQIVWTDEGKLFLDYSIGGIGATTLGYACDFVDERVINTIANGSATSLNSYEEVIATKKLIEAVPWIDSARYTRSGGEATTLAIRIARAKTLRTKVLFSGYHGWHDWYLCAAHSFQLGNHLLDHLPIAGVPKELDGTAIPFDYGDFDGFDRCIKKHIKDIAAVILEPMRYSMPDVKFLEHVKKFCSENGIILIYDEISSGFRFNNSAVHLDTNALPDLVVFSKAIGNGYPIGVIAGKSSVMEAVKDSFISSTTHTESVGFSAMSAVLDFYAKNNVSEMLNEKGGAVRKILIKTAKIKNLEITTKGQNQLWNWSFCCEPTLNRQLQTIVTESMLASSILFSNRVYATLGFDPDFYPIFERALNKAFQLVSDILVNESDPKDYINFGLNRLGIY